MLAKALPRTWLRSKIGKFSGHGAFVCTQSACICIGPPLCPNTCNQGKAHDHDMIEDDELSLEVPGSSLSQIIVPLRIW